MTGKQAAPAAPASARAGGKSDPAPAQRKAAEAAAPTGPEPAKPPLQAARTGPEKARAAAALQRGVGNRRAGRMLEAAARPGALPEPLKSGIENLSGLAMDDVRVNRNSPKPAALGALAITRGSDIHLGPGQEATLPHEAWHVAQQKAGRVRPTVQMSGHAVNDDPALEREADIMGARAASHSAKTGGRERAPPREIKNPSIQTIQATLTVGPKTYNSVRGLKNAMADDITAGYRDEWNEEILGMIISPRMHSFSTFHELSNSLDERAGRDTNDLFSRLVQPRRIHPGGHMLQSWP